MSGAAISGLEQYIDFVASLAPQLIDDVEALGGLYTQAAAAVGNAGATGQVQAADWSALLTLEAKLRAVLDTEAAAASTDQGPAGTG